MRLLTLCFRILRIVAIHFYTYYQLLTSSLIFATLELSDKFGLEAFREIRAERFDHQQITNYYLY